MEFMSPIYVFFALHEPYNINRNYDLIWSLNKDGEGLYIIDGDRQTVTLGDG